MLPLAKITGGFLATLGFLSLAVSGPASVEIITSVVNPPPAQQTADQLDRARKGDRLVGSNRSASHGPSEKRERAQQVPVKTLKEEKGQRLIGCDPLVSPLAGSSLSQVAGRCIADLSRNEKVAMVTR